MKLNKWEKIACIFIVILIITCIILYTYNFGLNLSSDSSDWGNFGSYISGTIITLLTVINIWLVYKLTIVIEEKNGERAIKGKIYETQGVITQMRMKLYEDIRPLINEIKVDLYTNRHTLTKLTELKKRLMEINTSFLFKHGANSFLRCSTEEILSDIKNIEAPRCRYRDVESLVKHLDSYLYQMEFYIIMQSIKDTDVYEYISKHQEDMDSAFRCVGDIASQALEELDNRNKNT